MEKKLLIDISSARESEETKNMLSERLLSIEKDEISYKVSNVLNCSGESSRMTSNKKIEPVSHMTVKNDNVRRETLPDGRPAPEPHANPCLIDILFYIPAMYLGEILGSIIAAALMVWSMNSPTWIFG